MAQEPGACGMDWDHVDPATSFKNRKLDAVDFSRRSLVGVDFSGSILHDCCFDDSDLSHANFANADLYRSTFKGSVLYATQFSGCNLTRCDFSRSYLYGFRLVELSNITYANFSGFQLERQRRSSVRGRDRSDLLEFRTGAQIETAAELCKSDYYANEVRFSFRPFSSREREMQRSQVYNRLRRLYEANAFSEEARHCLYLERYFRTRSRYLYHIFPEELTGGIPVSAFRRNRAWISAYIFEYLAAYGLSPYVVLRNLILVYLSYVVTVWLLLGSESQSGIAYVSLVIGPEGEVTEGSTGVVTAGSDDLPIILYFCFFSMFSLTFQRFSPFGHMVWLSSAFALLGLSLLALLVTTVYSVMRSD